MVRECNDIRNDYFRHEHESHGALDLRVVVDDVDMHHSFSSTSLSRPAGNVKWKAAPPSLDERVAQIEQP